MYKKKNALEKNNNSSTAILPQKRKIGTQNLFY